MRNITSAVIPARPRPAAVVRDVVAGPRAQVAKALVANLHACRAGADGSIDIKHMLLRTKVCTEQERV